MSDNSRAVRLGEAVKEIVASTLENKIRDPRLGFVTVTGAKVTGDLQHATVFYTVLGDEAQQQASAAALASAKGMLRTEVGRQTGVKHTPSLEFQLDHTPQVAADLAEAMRAARVRDAEIRALAEGKTPAGGANPYKTATDSTDPGDDMGEHGIPDEYGVPVTGLSPVDPAGFEHDADADDAGDPEAAAHDLEVAAQSFDADSEAMAEGETL